MQWLVVGLGGAAGALCRFAVGLCFPYQVGKFPVATFTVNVVGSLLMALCYVWLVERAILPAVWRDVLMLGFLGAFTTYSTFSMEVVQMLTSGYAKLALIYGVGSLIACVAAAYVGYSIFVKLI